MLPVRRPASTPRCRPARNPTRKMERLLAPKPADDREQVRRLAGMIQRPAAQVFGAAATSHVEAMRGATGFERGLRQAARIARGAGSFQAVNHNQLCDRLGQLALASGPGLGRPARYRRTSFGPESAARPNCGASSCRRWSTGADFESRERRAALVGRPRDDGNSSGQSLAHANRIRTIADSDTQGGIACALFHCDGDAGPQSKTSHLPQGRGIAVRYAADHGRHAAGPFRKANLLARRKRAVCAPGSGAHADRFQGRLISPRCDLPGARR